MNGLSGTDPSSRARLTETPFQAVKEVDVNTRARVRLLLFGIAACLCLAVSALGGQQIEGIVYYDNNQNGVYDPGEPVASQVAVSDGTSVATTDREGRYRLEIDDAASFVFVTIPSGAAPSADWYLPLASSASYDFPLRDIPQEGPLVFAQMSDIHYAPTPEEFKLGLRDRSMKILPDPVLDTICDEINASGVDFVIVTGDLAADSKYPEPEVVDAWIAAMADRLESDIDASAYAAVGNHDIVRDEAIGKTLYERHFGPTYYSFNVKGTHFVVLDTQRLEGTKLLYSVDARQLEWLESDLGELNAQTPIVVFCHEPTYDWADTPETATLFRLLEQTGITALVNGHWHTNVVLREEPFYELTSGAVCGAWWEGPGPDGSGFGYRVFRYARGTLDSLWRTGGEPTIDVSSPTTAVLTWSDRLQAQVWGEMNSASYAWDEQQPIPLDVHWNGLWSSVSADLNVSTLPDGYHSIVVSFVTADGSVISQDRSFLIANPAISLQEIFDHAATYQGKIVAAPELTVRAVMGSDISAFDETRTIIVSGFPYAVSRNDLIGLAGMYHPTATAPLKVYDDIFYSLIGGQDDE